MTNNEKTLAKKFVDAVIIKSSWYGIKKESKKQLFGKPKYKVIETELLESSDSDIFKFKCGIGYGDDPKDFVFVGTVRITDDSIILNIFGRDDFPQLEIFQLINEKGVLHLSDSLYSLNACKIDNEVMTRGPECYIKRIKPLRSVDNSIETLINSLMYDDGKRWINKDPYKDDYALPIKPEGHNREI